jgi:hypothetical protein
MHWALQEGRRGGDRGTTEANASINTNDVSGIGATTTGTRSTPTNDSVFGMPIPGAAGVTCLIERFPAPRVRREIAYQ